MAIIDFNKENKENKKWDGEKKENNPDTVMVENPDKNPELAKRKKASKYKGANISLHDIHSCVRIIDVMGERFGYNDDETSDVNALRQRLVKFLNFNVPEDYDMQANREATRKYAEAEQAKLDSKRNADGSIDSEFGKRLEPSGGAPFPI